MGLSIGYDFRVACSASDAERIVQKLQRIASRMKFDEVQPVRRAADLKLSQLESTKSKRGWDLFYGRHYLEKELRGGKKRYLPIPALQVFLFGINSAGSETALIGLASHPAHHEGVADGKSFSVDTGLEGLFTWGKCCKTQYAALPQHGGVENFIRLHTGIISLFDAARELGVDVEARDDGDFWATRDRSVLLENLKEHDQIVAAIVGRIKDTFGDRDDGLFVAPITSNPAFEHLEAEGRRMSATRPPSRKKK